MANPNIKRAVRVALVAASAGGAAMYGAATVAQEAELEQVIVTGSRIPQPNLEGTSPVSLITSQEVALQGVQHVEDLLNNMPQVFAGQGGTYSNGATNTLATDASTRLARPWFTQQGSYTYEGDYLYGGGDNEVNTDNARPLVTGSNGASRTVDWNPGEVNGTSISASTPRAR